MFDWFYGPAPAGGGPRPVLWNRVVGSCGCLALLLLVGCVILTLGAYVFWPRGAAPTTPTPPARGQTGRNQPTGSGPYTSMKMSEFNYTWTYTDQLGLQTPRLRDDAQSSGKGVWSTHDIGIPPGTFGVIKGVTINIGSTTLGTPCALGMLSPGYYRNIRGLEWRFEVYFLPQDDATGWAKVLADQAQTTEHTLYQCPSKGLSEIPVFFSSEATPFGP